MLKSAAQRHYKRCTKGAWRGGLNIGGTKITVELNLNRVNEERISGAIFAETSHVFQNLDGKEVKGMCTFQVKAEKHTEEQAPIIRDVYFTTITEEMQLLTYRNTTLQWSQQLQQDIDEWTANGSGFVITNIVRAYCTFLTYQGRFGGGDATLPDRFYDGGKVLHVINRPDWATDCLKVCMTIASSADCYAEVEKTTTELRKTHGILIDYMQISPVQEIEELFAGFEEPFPLSEIPRLARESTAQFNILKLHNNNNKFSLSVLHASRGAESNILYYNNHFYPIGNLTKLVCFVSKKKRKHSTQSICTKCLQYFDTRYHSVEEHESMCKVSKGTIVTFPKEGSVREYRQFMFQVKSPAMLVFDMEASNSKNTNHLSTAATSVKTIHKINSYALFTHIEDDLFNFPYDQFEERLIVRNAADDSEDSERIIIKRFMRDVYDIAQKLTDWQSSIDTESQLRGLKKKHAAEYNASNTCIYCGGETLETKVFDHDHYRNKYNGPAHGHCNLIARKQREIPLYAHNTSYDVNLFMKYIGSEDMYASEGHWKLSMVGSNVKFACAGIVVIKDSYAILPMALSTLGKQIPDADCIYQKRYGSQIEGDYGKGIYPYEYIDSVDKLKETEFPPLHAFENSLGNRVFEEDYEKAKDFFDNHCTTMLDYHNYYLIKDVLVLADALIKFRGELYDMLGLDIIRAYSLPQFSFAALMKTSMVQIPHVTCPSMYAIAKKCAKGGLNIVAKRVSEVTDSDKSRIMYLDMKSMYVSTMEKPLPCGVYEFIPNPTLTTLLSLVR